MWDADKARVIGGAPEGAFVLTFTDGESLPGDWWSARGADGEVVGYGRLDTTWGGDAEILLAVAPDRQESGVGTFILGKLDEEAAVAGPQLHPQPDPRPCAARSGARLARRQGVPRAGRR